MTKDWIEFNENNFGSFLKTLRKHKFKVKKSKSKKVKKKTEKGKQIEGKIRTLKEGNIKRGNVRDVNVSNKEALRLMKSEIDEALIEILKNAFEHGTNLTIRIDDKNEKITFINSIKEGNKDIDFQVIAEKLTTYNEISTKNLNEGLTLLLFFKHFLRVKEYGIRSLLNPDPEISFFNEYSTESSSHFYEKNEIWEDKDGNIHKGVVYKSPSVFFNEIKRWKVIIYGGKTEEIIKEKYPKHIKQLKEKYKRLKGITDKKESVKKGIERLEKIIGFKEKYLKEVKNLHQRLKTLLFGKSNEKSPYSEDFGILHRFTIPNDFNIHIYINGEKKRFNSKIPETITKNLNNVERIRFYGNKGEGEYYLEMPSSKQIEQDEDSKFYVLWELRGEGFYQIVNNKAFFDFGANGFVIVNRNDQFSGDRRTSLEGNVSNAVRYKIKEFVKQHKTEHQINEQIKDYTKYKESMVNYLNEVFNITKKAINNVFFSKTREDGFSNSYWDSDKRERLKLITNYIWTIEKIFKRDHKIRDRMNSVKYRDWDDPEDKRSKLYKWKFKDISEELGVDWSEMFPDFYVGTLYQEGFGTIVSLTDPYIQEADPLYAISDDEVKEIQGSKGEGMEVSVLNPYDNMEYLLEIEWIDPEEIKELKIERIEGIPALEGFNANKRKKSIEEEKEEIDKEKREIEESERTEIESLKATIDLKDLNIKKSEIPTLITDHKGVDDYYDKWVDKLYIYDDEKRAIIITDKDEYGNYFLSEGKNIYYDKEAEYFFELGEKSINTGKELQSLEEGWKRIRETERYILYERKGEKKYEFLFNSQSGIVKSDKSGQFEVKYVVIIEDLIDNSYELWKRDTLEQIKSLHFGGSYDISYIVQLDNGKVFFSFKELQEYEKKKKEIKCSRCRKVIREKEKKVYYKEEAYHPECLEKVKEEEIEKKKKELEEKRKKLDEQRFDMVKEFKKKYKKYERKIEELNDYPETIEIDAKEWYRRHKNSQTIDADERKNKMLDIRDEFKRKIKKISNYLIELEDITNDLESQTETLKENKEIINTLKKEDLTLRVMERKEDLREIRKKCDKIIDDGKSITTKYRRIMNDIALYQDQLDRLRGKKLKKKLEKETTKITHGERKLYILKITLENFTFPFIFKNETEYKEWKAYKLGEKPKEDLDITFGLPISALKRRFLIIQKVIEILCEIGEIKNNIYLAFYYDNHKDKTLGENGRAFFKKEYNLIAINNYLLKRGSFNELNKTNQIYHLIDLISHQLTHNKYDSHHIRFLQRKEYLMEKARIHDVKQKISKFIIEDLDWSGTF
jgi:hypothetical protein